MIKLIVGKKGSGKTKHLIDEANDTVKKTKGNIVYIDINNSHMFQIDYRIRFTSMKDYHISDDIGFYGFLCGIISSNYDVEGIYIDGLLEITNSSIDKLQNFFNKLSLLEIRYNLNFIFSIPHGDEELPEFLSQYKIYELADIEE